MIGYIVTYLQEPDGIRQEFLKNSNGYCVPPSKNIQLTSQIRLHVRGLKGSIPNIVSNFEKELGIPRKLLASQFNVCSMKTGESCNQWKNQVHTVISFKTEKI